MSSQKTKGKQRDTIPRILNTAAAVFAESGFAGARMDEIADRAGVNKLAGILAEGEKQGRFIHVNPISVHFLVIGALIFYKVGTPIREKFTEISESLRSMITNESGKFVDEIEHLVLRSLRQ